MCFSGRSEVALLRCEILLFQAVFYLLCFSPLAKRGETKGDLCFKWQYVLFCFLPEVSGFVKGILKKFVQRYFTKKGNQSSLLYTICFFGKSSPVIFRSFFASSICPFSSLLIDCRILILFSSSTLFIQSSYNDFASCSNFKIL